MAAMHALLDAATASYFTLAKQELLDEMTRRGLKTSKGLPVRSQAFATMLENQLYVGIVNAPQYRLNAIEHVVENQRIESSALADDAVAR